MQYQYLVDTNVWLERLLSQERSSAVAAFLNAVPASRLALTDFALHSIGVVLLRLGEAEAFLHFVRDLREGQVALLSLAAADMDRIVECAARLHLDFDDAYQYVAAERYGLTLVSFDADFDRTERGRKTPEQVLQELAQ